MAGEPPEDRAVCGVPALLDTAVGSSGGTVAWELTADPDVGAEFGPPGVVVHLSSAVVDCKLSVATAAWVGPRLLGNVVDPPVQAVVAEVTGAGLGCVEPGAPDVVVDPWARRVEGELSGGAVVCSVTTAVGEG